MKIKLWAMSLLAIFTIGGGVSAAIMPQSVYAASGECESSFLGFPAWYRGLAKKDSNGNCNIVSPGDFSGGLSGFILHIAMNGLQIALTLAGYLAVAFIMYGGVQFLTSQGEVAIAAKARKTILDAVIGLVISLIAVAIVNFIMARVF